MQVKEFGKVKIYLAKQDTFECPSAEELAEMDAQIISLKEQLAAASEQHKMLQAELKGVESALSDEQLQLQLAEYQTTSNLLEQKLASLKNPEPGAPPPISADQMSTIEKSLAKFSTEWKKRKRICYDVLNKFSEQNGKKVKVIGEEIGIEFDEDVGAVLSPTPTIGAPSRGPPSAMMGRVYPPVMAAKVNVPAKVTPSIAVKSVAVAPKPLSTAAKPIAQVKPVVANKAVAKAAAPKSRVASKKKAKTDSESDSDSDSDSFSENGSSSPDAPKKKPATASKAPAVPKGKPASKTTTTKVTDSAIKYVIHRQDGEETTRLRNCPDGSTRNEVWAKGNASVSQGEVVEVLRRDSAGEKGFAFIRTASNTEGFVRSEYIQSVSSREVSGAGKPVSKPAAKKAAKTKANTKSKTESDSESSFNSSDDSESSDSDSTPMVKSVASKTPRAAAAKASANLNKKSKADSDSDFEE